jgi:hypothetical protein
MSRSVAFVRMVGWFWVERAEKVEHRGAFWGMGNWTAGNARRKWGTMGKSGEWWVRFVLGKCARELAKRQARSWAKRRDGAVGLSERGM